MADLKLQDDMDNIFLDVGFEETVTYTPSDGIAKNIDAIVYREGVNEIVESKRTGVSQRKWDIGIDISTDATNGIETITVNEDTVKLYKNIGDSIKKTFTVAGIIQNDAGAFRLGLR